MFGWLCLICLYALVATSGVRITSAIPLNGLLGKCLMVFTVASAQLVVSIQLLSLVKQLTGEGLLLFNAIMTGATFVAGRRRSPIRHGALRARGMLAIKKAIQFAGDNPFEGAILATAVLSVLVSSGVGWVICPMTDNYHFAMPLFWKQHASILPFPAYDPRLLGVVFGSEALCFPGLLYARTAAVWPLLSALACLLTMWVVAAISRKIGCSIRASVCAGAMLAGYGPVSVSLFGAMADLLLSALWFGAAVYFLLESRPKISGEIQHASFGCSILCLLMACGAKNIVTLQVPSFLLACLLIHGRRILSGRWVKVAAAGGGIGLLASSVLWSYSSNSFWFGTIRGGKELQATLSTDHRPGAVWTRITRGVVTLLFDVVWLPQAYQDKYAHVSLRTIQLLGGKDRLSEDYQFYSFSERSLRPGLGLGILGVFVFAPGVLAGILHCLKKQPPEHREGFRVTASLVVLTVGSFLFCYALLRWQSIGITRLMLSWIVVGAPLSAMVLERKWLRIPAFALMLASLMVYLTYGLGMAIRRHNVADRNWLAAKISRLQRDHSVQIEYEWQDGRSGSLNVREGYTRREVFQLLFSRITQPAVIGVIGSFHFEGSYAFGKEFSHKVVSLADSRTPRKFRVPPADVEYVLVDAFVAEFKPSDISPEVLHGFHPWFQVKQAGVPMFVAFQRQAER